MPAKRSSLTACISPTVANQARRRWGDATKEDPRIKSGGDEKGQQTPARNSKRYDGAVIHRPATWA